jgi:hypothetical protein
MDGWNITMNLHAKTELLKRFSTAQHVEGLRSTVESVFALGIAIDSAKKHAADDLNLSDAGRKAYVSKVAQDNVRPLVQVTASMRKAVKYNTDRRANLKPPTPPRDDLVGEMRRAELRAFARSLKMSERLPFALKHPEAILDAPGELSGLPDEQFSKVRETYIAAKFGPEIAEIETLDEDLSTVMAAHDLALAELRANAGLSEREFAKMVDKITREIDGV